MSELEIWKKAAMDLWQIIDDIDTASDMFKPEKTAYYNFIQKQQAKRHVILFSDGYNLTLPGHIISAPINKETPRPLFDLNKTPNP